MSTIDANMAKLAKTGARLVVMLIAAILMLAIPGTSRAAEKAEMENTHRPKDFIVTVDPDSAKKIGPAVVKQIVDFFDYADNAIKTKDLDALAFLYSDQYRDGNHTKADAVQAWKTLFTGFDDFSMTHNLRFITADANSNVMIVACSGILMAKPKSDKVLRALDHWVNMKHVLVKENNGWKIIGTSGIESKRFWFDKPMHPLF